MSDTPMNDKPAPDREPDPAGDRWLRRALEPEPAAVRRIVEAAAGDGEPAAGAHRWGWLAAAVAIVATVATAFVLVVAPPPPTATTGDGAGDTRARLRISNENGPIVVTSTAGYRWVQLHDPGGEP